MNRLDGKVALITGTGGGMGRAAAVVFAAAGAKVVGCDVKPEGAQETVALVTANGGEMVSLAPADLTEPATAQAVVDLAVHSYGGIDVLYNNAADARFGALHELSFEDWSYTLRYELDLIYLVTHAAWPHLVASGNGSIINTASMAAARGARFSPMAAHGAGKGGVAALTLHMAAAGAGHNIRANAILPGLIRTPATEREGVFDPDSPAAQVIALNPMGRAGEPEDVARLALFLASDDAAYVNAEAIKVDGGAANVV
jgi:meso-butanediol dehydrogenase / (S,S)-butanediol dehydrogenase / diacetyl reductase